jgi:hypothetical protein
LDGRYEVVLLLPPSGDPDISIAVENDTLFKGTVSDLEPRRFAVSLHAGISIPHGSLNTSHDPGFGITADLEYWWTPRFGVAALLGYHRFGAAGAGDDLDLLHASGALETRITSGRTSVLLDAGAGYYDLSPGSGEPGVHAGAGLERELSPAVSLGVSGRVHTVFTSGSNTTFTSVQAGGRLKF